MSPTTAPIGLAVALVAVAICGDAAAQTRRNVAAHLPQPPAVPNITEPAADGQIVSAADVHMETEPMLDANPGDTHLCSDWEIWTLVPSERVWFASCVTGLEKVHAHLGDGVFEASHAGFTELLFSTDYRLRARHRDQTGLWSGFAERFFTTAAETQILPLEEDDAADTPLPRWEDETGFPLELPAGATPGSLRVDAFGVGLLFELTGQSAPGDALTNPGELPSHEPVRVSLAAGSSALAVPESQVYFTSHGGEDLTLYLPSLSLGAGQVATLWISENGSSYHGTQAQTSPDFSDLARSAPVPWKVLQPGYRVDVVASGFRLPVNIAFVPNPGGGPLDPKLYVSELYGSIKVVTNDGTVGDYATGLLNFTPSGNFPGSGETGLAGLCVDPVSGDVFAGMLYDDGAPGGPTSPKVARFSSTDGGLTAATQTDILLMPGETQVQSHFISNLSIGPDGKLYVHMGDGFNASTALNLNSFRGKILRLNLDGSAPVSNPFFQGPSITARDYVFAYGVRNPFGGDWWNGELYEVENGPGQNDRLARVVAGASYGWNGSSASMTIGASYTWVTPHGPVDIAFVQPGLFGGSQFPPAVWNHAFVTESGPTWASGPQSLGKRIVEFVFDSSGALLAGPTPLIEYDGSGKATACGIAAGPDGLYFTDLYRDLGASGPTDSGANVLRIRSVGTADFTSDVVAGAAPLAVQFTDLSTVQGAATWSWDFGDGATSALQDPLHVYTANGSYTVRLAVTGTGGVAVEQKNDYVFVGDVGVGLKGGYYAGTNFGSLLLTRTDPVIDFDWSTGSPDPAVPADFFSVRWTGEVEPQFSETYDFITTTDDGVRLWVDGTLLIDQWIPMSATSHSGQITLVGGQRYDIRMEFYEQTGDAAAILEWESPSQPREVIPTEHLYPAP